MATKQNHDAVPDGQGNNESHRDMQMYLRFGAMILTAMVVMYGVMYMATWEWSHVRWSTSRFFMALAMGGTMGLVMLAWMLNMYRNTKLNVAIIAVSFLLLIGGVSLDRSQTGIGDTAFMSAMIPHHSIAILRSERAGLDDVRVCQLAVEISKAQRREISEMEWLIEDIGENGSATTLAEAEARPVPDFEAGADRQCPTD
ncbi:MAG: DUF305 domain-containing protein [Thermomicrobiales bacterium]